MKETYYFSHDYNAREDEKIQELIFKEGYSGYGIYWAIIEMLYQNEGYMNNDCERIAFALNTQKDIILSVINNFNLFKLQGNRFTSESVLHRLRKRKGKSEKARQSAQARWNKQDTKEKNAMRTHSECNAIKESKVKESKVNNIYIGEFEIAVKKYPAFRRKGKDVALKRFSKSVTTDKQLEEFKIALNNYLTSEEVKNNFVLRMSKWFDEWQDWIEIEPSKSKSWRD